MKIISSYQDFYEFDCWKYGSPSDFPIWVRQEAVKKLNNTESNRYLRNFVNSLFMYVGDPLYNFKGDYSRNNLGIEYRIFIRQEIIGIYPYLYWVPKISIVKEHNYSMARLFDRYDEYHLSIEETTQILINPKSYMEILLKYGINPKKCLYPSCLTTQYKNRWRTHDEDRDINETWITEDKQLFDWCESPIIRFVKPNSYIDDYEIEINTNITNTDLLKYYPEILTDRDVYTEMENWVIASKQEPIATPDNNTKITSHGFDLKTSFRKM